jgi:hypothetical protein
MNEPFRRRTRKLARLALVAAVATLLYRSWIAVVDDSGSDELIVPLRVAQAGEAQLFYDVGAGFSERDSVRRTVEPAKQLEPVAFAVPRASLREVRFDPLPGAGEFRIGPPRLVSPSGRLIAKFPLTAIAPRNEIAELRREGDALAGKTVAGATDPQLTLGLGAPVKAGRVRLPWIEAAIAAGLAWVVGWLGERAKG